MDLDTTFEIKYIIRLEEQIKNLEGVKYKKFGTYTLPAKESKEIRDATVVILKQLIDANNEIIALKNMVKDLKCKTPKKARYIDRFNHKNYS